MDHRLLKRTAQEIKYLQEHLAKRVVVLGSMGEKAGREKLENSMRLLVNPLQHLVSDIQVNYLEHSAIGNADEIENLKENCVYLMENLNFLPDENSYVEPFIEPKEEEEETNAEKTEEKEEDSKGKPIAKPGKKLSAAE